MRWERRRFASFKDIAPEALPHGTNPTILAGEGCYFDRQRLKVRCFSCGREYGPLFHAEDCERQSRNRPFRFPPSPPPQPAPPEDLTSLNVNPVHHPPQATGTTHDSANQGAAAAMDDSCSSNPVGHPSASSSAQAGKNLLSCRSSLSLLLYLCCSPCLCLLPLSDCLLQVSVYLFLLLFSRCHSFSISFSLLFSECLVLCLSLFFSVYICPCNNPSVSLSIYPFACPPVSVGVYMFQTMSTFSVNSKCKLRYGW